MIEDLRQFYKYYKLYKKGKKEMEKFGEFIKEHKNEIIFVSVVMLSYKLGFNKGFNTAKNAMSHVFNEASRTLPVARS